jgi:hypothetical protein
MDSTSASDSHRCSGISLLPSTPPACSRTGTRNEQFTGDGLSTTQRRGGRQRTTPIAAAHDFVVSLVTRSSHDDGRVDSREARPVVEDA